MTSQLTVECRIDRAENAYGLGCIGLLFKIRWYRGGGGGGVKPEDRNLLRFLWIDDVNSLNPEIIKLRFTRLVFGLVCSSFILNVTLRNHLSKYEHGQKLRRTLTQSL